MSEDDKRWRRDGDRFGWVMPTATWWKRLPVIRWFRWQWGRWQVAKHNSFHMSRGAIPTGYDAWVLYGIARGFERATRPEEARDEQ